MIFTKFKVGHLSVLNL